MRRHHGRDIGNPVHHLRCLFGGGAHGFHLFGMLGVDLQHEPHGVTFDIQRAYNTRADDILPRNRVGDLFQVRQNRVTDAHAFTPVYLPNQVVDFHCMSLRLIQFI